MNYQKAYPGNMVRIKKGKWSSYLAVVSSVDRNARRIWDSWAGVYRDRTILSYKLSIPKVGYRRFSSAGFDFVSPKEEDDPQA